MIINHLSLAYGSRTLAEGVSLNLNSGQLVALIGHNGCGKSTLLRTLCALQKPASGQVVIGGDNISTLSAKEMAQRVSIVLTERITHTTLSVKDMVAMGLAPYTNFFGTLSPQHRQTVDEAMQTMGIGHLAQQQVNTLSDGEYQKVMIAKALAQQTPVMLLDEPTAFLDFESKVSLLRTLAHLAQTTGRLILFSTHDINLAHRLAHTLLLFRHRTIAPCTSIEELREFVGKEAAEYL